MPAARDLVERGFLADFFDDAHRFPHVDVERVDVVVPVGDAFDESVTFAVHLREPARKSLGGCGQYRVVEFVAGFVLFDDGVHHADGIVERVPRFLAAGMAFAVDGHHRVVAADEADAQRTAAQDVAHLVVRSERSAAFPDVVAHHERELPGQSRPLILVAFVELFGDHGRHRTYLFEKDVAGLAPDGVFVAVGVHVFGLAPGFDGQTGHVHRRERQVAPSPRAFLAVQVFEYAGAASHRRHLVAEAVGIVGPPAVVFVELRIEKYEVREERRGRRAAGFEQQVEVGRREPELPAHRTFEVGQCGGVVLLAVRNAVLDLENLDREDRHFAVAQSLDGRGEQFADDHAAFGRSVRSVVHRAEYHLIAASRVHRVEVVDKTFHRLVGIPAGRFVGLLPYGVQLVVRKLHSVPGQHARQRSPPGFVRLDRPHVLPKQFLERFFRFGFRRPRIFQTEQEENVRRQMFDERFEHARRHEEVERGDRLSPVLFVLVRLEDDRGQRRVALYRLRRPDRAVLGVEPAAEQVVQIVLYAGRRFGRVIVQIVDVDVAVAVRSGIADAEQVFVGVVLGHFRCESHHLAGRRVRRHVGVAQVDVVFLHGHDAVHDLFDRGALVTLDVAPLAVDDVFFGDVGVAGHQFLFHEVLNLLDGNHLVGDGGGHVGGDLPDRVLLIVDSAGTVGFGHGADDFVQRESFAFPVPLEDGNVRKIHNRIVC